MKDMEEEWWWNRRLRIGCRIVDDDEISRLLNLRERRAGLERLVNMEEVSERDV